MFWFSFSQCVGLFFFKAGIFNSDVKLQIPFTLLKCFEKLEESVRTACTGGYV